MSDYNTPTSSRSGWSSGSELTGNPRHARKYRTPVVSKVLLSLNSLSPHSQLLYRSLFPQAILAMFYHNENGYPVSNEDYPSIIMELYRRKVGIDAPSMDQKGPRMV